MADTGWLSPGTTVDDDSGGTKAWNNPNNSQVSDNIYAVTFGGISGAVSHYLKATNFGAAVPVGATIDGIVVEFERYPVGANLVSDFRIYVGKTGGAFGDENKAAAGYWATSQTYYSYGGVDDLWSDTWTPAEINNATFGLSISVVMLANGIGYIDHIRIKVYYTEPTEYSITAEGGSYTETGQDASLLKSSLLGIGIGTYTETGQIASLLRSIRISAVAGSYSITGKAVNLRRTIVYPEEDEGGRKSFTTFKSELLWILGNRSSSDINSLEGTLINNAYLELCSKNKFWKFEVPKTFSFPELDVSTTETGNDGDAYIAEPTGSLLVYTVWDMASDNELSYKDHSWYVTQAGRAKANCEARPSYWIPYSDKIYLYPTLNAEYNFKIYFRKHPVILTGTQNTVIGEEWDEPILMLAVIRGLMLLRDFKKSKEWREKFVTTVQGLMGMQVRQARYTRDRLIPTSQHTQKHGY